MIESVFGQSVLGRVVQAIDRQSRAWLEGSRIGAALSWLSDRAGESRLLDALLGLGARPGMMEGSLVGRGLAAFTGLSARLLGGPAGRWEGSTLARWWRGSLLSRAFTYEAGVAFVLAYVPVSLWLTLYLPYAIKYAAEGVLLLMLGALAVQVLTGRRKLVWTSLDVPVLLWIAVGLISALLNGGGLVQTGAGLRAMLQYYLLALIISNAGLDRQRLRSLLIGLFGLVTLLALHGVYQRVAGVPTPPEWLDVTEQHIGTRAFGTMANPNTYAGYLALFAAPLLALFTVRMGAGARLLVTGSLLTVVLAILFSLSRSAWMALALAMVLISIARDRRIMLLLIVGALLLPAVSPTMAGRLAQGFSMAYLNKSAAGGRIDWWNRAQEVAAVNPVFGVGPGQFGGAVANYFGTKANVLVNLPERHPIWVDSQYFQYIAEVGYLGLAIFFWIIITFLRAARDVYRRSDEMTGALVLGFAAAVVGLLVQSTFASIWEMQQITSVVWFGMGLIGMLQRDGTQTAPQA